MTTAFDKFRKLLAAYEDEVQRKQQKMNKRVDPEDLVQPNWHSGYCTFLRGQDVVWSPSFELIGTFTPATRAWVWGWADPNIDPKLKNRVDAVRTQGAQWGIDIMTSEGLQIADEAQAWELATVATAVSRADGMYRVVDGEHQRYLALFDGPPASRSSTSMRAIRDSQMGMQAVQMPASTASPALQRINTPAPRSAHTWGTQPGSLPASSTPISAPSSTISNPVSGLSGEEREPTAQTRTELAQRLYEALPYVHQQQLGTLSMLARAIPPAGPVGTVSLDVRLTLRPSSGGPEVQIPPTGALNDALASLWMRCRDRQGGPYRFATAKLEPGPQGLQANVFLEW